MGMSTITKCYRMAVATNNMGITLMERGFNTEARRAFKQCLALLKLASFDHLEESFATMTGSIETATRVMVYTSSPSSQHETTRLALHPVVLHAGSHLSLPSALLSQERTALYAFPIRVDTTTEYAKQATEYDLRELSTVILYNFAVSHFPIAHAARTPDMVYNVCKLALSIFKLALDSLEGSHRSCCNQEANDLVLQIELLICHSVIPLMRYTGALAQAQYAHNRLQHLKQTLCAHMKVFICYEAEACAAAA